MAHNDKVLEAEGEGEVRAPPPAAPVPPGALFLDLAFPQCHACYADFGLSALQEAGTAAEGKAAAEERAAAAEEEEADLADKVNKAALCLSKGGFSNLSSWSS